MSNQRNACKQPCYSPNLSTAEVPSINPPVNYSMTSNILRPTSAVKNPDILCNENTCNVLRKSEVQPANLEMFGLSLDQQPIFHYSLVSRPDYGKLGKPINLIVNCFRIVVPDGYIYHYDVEIHNKNQCQDLAAFVPIDEKKKYRCIGTKKNREILNTLMDSYGEFKGYHPAYDGRKNLYTRKLLKNTPLKREVRLETNNKMKDRCETFIVVIKPVQKKETKSCAINLDTIHAFFDGSANAVPQEALMALETVLRNSPCLKFTPIGRSFFYPPAYDAQFPVGGGQEVWFGYHQSMRMGQWSPLVNLDISATVFYEKGPVLDYICKVLNWQKADLLKKPRLTDFEIRCMAKELKNLKIQTTHLKYKKKQCIIKVTREPANKLEFLMTKEGNPRHIKVSEYFLMKYNYKLQYPQLPCLQVAPQSKNIYLPIEICEILEGQHYKKCLTDDQKKEMIKFTAHQPKERFAKIEEIVDQADFNADITCNEFELRVDQKPIRLQGRVYEAPSICYSNNSSVNPREGQWDMRDKKYIRGGVVGNWVLLSFADANYCSREDLGKFSQMLVSICQERGMTMKNPVLIETFREREITVDVILENMKSQYKAELAVIVVPRFDKTLYGLIKHAAETVLGLKTQCIKEDNIKKCYPALIKNVSLKLNAKLGGVNNFVSAVVRTIMEKPIIIIGADVTHPMPSEKVKSSVAAVVGSIDAFPSRYAATCRTQMNSNEKKKGSEIIQDLKTMVMEVLKAFYRNTKGKKPEKIIFYRDGVSESQFEMIKIHEVHAIRQACQSLSSDYKPGITFIVVQKRHHIRFRTEDPRDGVGKCRNIPPGTTVDRIVTHPTSFDFFQCSHYSPLGTARPAYYTVLEDDNGLSSDQLQKLTYHLCFTYARCTKSISVVAPVMYAHLAAFRARQWLLSQVDDNSSAESDFSSALGLSESELKNTKIVNEMINSMYFV